jgi:uncharacterized coiled-coil DUF342 family protein
MSNENNNIASEMQHPELDIVDRLLIKHPLLLAEDMDLAEAAQEIRDLRESLKSAHAVATAFATKIQEVEKEIVRLKEEREEARRLACFLRAEIESTEPMIYCRKVAEEYKWDCFKDDSALGYHEEEANANNQDFRTTDMG